MRVGAGRCSETLGELHVQSIHWWCWGLQWVMQKVHTSGWHVGARMESCWLLLLVSPWSHHISSKSGFIFWAGPVVLACFKYTFTMLLKLCSYCLSIVGWMCSWGNIRQDFSWNGSLKLLQQVLCCRNAEQLSPLCTFLCTPVLPYSARFVQCPPPKKHGVLEKRPPILFIDVLLVGYLVCLWMSAAADPTAWNSAQFVICT